MIQLEPGDVVLTASTSRLGRLIRFCQRSRGEEKAEVNHGEMIVEAGLLYTAMVVGALATVKRRTMLKGHGGKKNEDVKIAVFRPLFVQPKQLEQVVKVMEAYVGNPYGPLKLPLHLFDWCIGRALFWRKKKHDPMVFRRIARLKHMPICLGLVGLAYWKGAGVRLGRPWWAVQPDDAWDHFKLNPGMWMQVVGLITLREAKEKGL